MPSDSKNIVVKIAVTGTPGTGKTTVAQKLADKGYDIIHLTQYFEENDIGEKINGEREIEIEEMVEEIQSEDLSEDVIIEGHLAHYIPSDICVVLRCRPDELRERLSIRDYTDEKVEENIEAEKIDIVLSEVVKNQKTIIEVDTTDKLVDETIGEIMEKVEKGVNDYGNVDWTDFI